MDAEHRASVEARLGAAKLLDDDTQLADLDAAANLLVVEDDVTRVGVLGFCMGGYYTFKAAATGRFDAAVAFYGMLRTPEGWRGPGHKTDPLDLAAQMCPTLAIFGGNDPYTPPEDIAALREAWQDRDDCEIIVDRGRGARLRARPGSPDPPRRRRRRVVATCDRVAPRLRPRCRGQAERAVAVRPTSCGVELVAVEDPVLAAAGDLEPSEPDERGDRLVHALARRADHPGQLLLGERHPEVVLAAGQLEQSLRGAAGDVEEHGVRERLVGGAEAAGEDLDDGPQQLGPRLEHRAHVVEVQRDRLHGGQARGRWPSARRRRTAASRRTARPRRGPR